LGCIELLQLEHAVQVFFGRPPAVGIAGGGQFVESATDGRTKFGSALTQSFEAVAATLDAGLKLEVAERDEVGNARPALFVSRRRGSVVLRTRLQLP
jgi:hypothetical protein